MRKIMDKYGVAIVSAIFITLIIIETILEEGW